MGFTGQGSSACLPRLDVLSQCFRKSDLADPARSSALVRFIVERLVEAETGMDIGGKFQPLVEWMVEDPHLRERIRHMAEMVLV